MILDQIIWSEGNRDPGMDHEADIQIKNWPLAEWNQRLVAGLLRNPSEDGSFDPIYNLAITREVFARAANAEHSPQSVVHAFLECLRHHLSKRRRALDVDGIRLYLSLGWNPTADFDPPFWAHLVFSCFVASAPEVIGDRDFRRRMKMLLGSERSLQLLRLPRLWEDVAEWTKCQRRMGRNCRELVLPQPGWKKLIGYSLLFAFPSRKDSERLVRVLGANDLLGIEPPVRLTSKAIEAGLRTFSNRFGQEYSDFRQQWHTDPTKAARNRFWSAVRDVALYGKPSVKSAEVSFGLAISQDTDGIFSCWVTSDRDFSQGQFFALSADLFGSEVHLVHLGNRDFSGADDAVSRCVFGKEKSPITVRGLARAVQERVLLFEQTAPGFFTWRSTFPERERLVFLIQSEAVLEFVRAFGGKSFQSQYSGWYGVEGCTRSHLLKAQKKLPKVFQTLRCLQPTAPPTRIWLSGQLYADSGTASVVGLPELLPHLRVDGADSVVAEPEVADIPSHALKRVQTSSDEWAFPNVALDGRFTIAAATQRAVFATRSVSFSGRYYGHEFLSPSSAQSWLVENPSGLIEDFELEMQAPSPAEEGMFEADEFGIDLQNPAPYVASEGEKKRTRALSIALASMLTHQKTISEMEVYEVFMRVLGVESWRVPQILRTWLESNRLRRLYARSWRTRSYVAVKPHFVAYRCRGQIHGTTMGLFYPELLQAVTGQAEKLGAGVRELHSTSPWSPMSIRVSSGSLDVLVAISGASGLNSVRTIYPPKRALRSVAELILQGQNPNGRRTKDSPPAMKIGSDSEGNPVHIDEIRYRAAPNEYCVRVGEKGEFGSKSRAASLLAAFSFIGERPFEEIDKTGLQMRNRFAFLPLAAGELASAFDISSPAPEFRSQKGYTYRFASAELRRAVSDALYSTQPISGGSDSFAYWLVESAISCSPKNSRVPVSALGGVRCLKGFDVLDRVASRGGIPDRLVPIFLELLRRTDSPGKD
jgi:hypothetical protein